MKNENITDKKIRLLEKYEKEINLRPYLNSIDNLYTTLNYPSKKDKLFLRIALFTKYKELKTLHSCKNRNECFKKIAIEAAKNFIKEFPYLPHKNLTLKKLFGIPSNNKKNHKKFAIKKYSLLTLKNDPQRGLQELQQLEYIIKTYGDQEQTPTSQILDAISLAKEGYYLNAFLRQKGNHSETDLHEAENILKAYFPQAKIRIPTEKDLEEITRTPDLLLEEQENTVFVELKVWNELTPYQDLKLMEQVIAYALLSKTCILLITLKDQSLYTYLGEYTMKTFIKKIQKRIQELNKEKEDIIKIEREQQRQVAKQILKKWLYEDEEISTDEEPVIMEMELLTIIHGIANEELGLIQNQILNGQKLLKHLQKNKNAHVKIIKLQKPTSLQELITNGTYTIGIIEEEIEQQEQKTEITLT